MTDSDFEAWLDEECRKLQIQDNPTSIHLDHPRDSYDKRFILGARAAWAKAQDEFDKRISEHPEYNKLVIFFEQFVDLSGCYDAEDVVRIGQRWVDDLKQQADKLAEALETLKVAVNDKVNDPGATAFIERALKEYRGE